MNLCHCLTPYLFLCLLSKIMQGSRRENGEFSDLDACKKVSVTSVNQAVQVHRLTKYFQTKQQFTAMFRLSCSMSSNEM